MKSYSEKLKDPRWQKKRLEILQRDDWACRGCHDSESTLHVHHKRYIRGRDPWDYDEDSFMTLCEKCHKQETSLREEYEQVLIDALKITNLTCMDVHDLACSFAAMRETHLTEVVLSVIYRFMRDETFQRKMIEFYFSYLHMIKDKK